MVEKLEGVVEKTVVEVDKHDAAYMRERSKAKDAPPALSSGLSEWGKSGQKRSDWTEKAACVVLLLFVQHTSASLCRTENLPADVVARRWRTSSAIGPISRRLTW